MKAFTCTVVLDGRGGVDADADAVDAVLEVDWLRKGLGVEMGWTWFVVTDAGSGGVSEV